MDMKRILQAIDGVATKPVEGANDMKKFLQVITEGSNPHKVTLPVQMVIQHYQAPQEKKVLGDKSSPIRTSLKKYFQEAEQAVIAEQAVEREHKQQILRQYASTIAERVLMKEGKQDSVEVSAKRAAIKDLTDKDIYKNHKDKEIKDIDHNKKVKYLSEKSKTEKQARFMAAAAHDPAFAARTGIKQSVAKEFNKADTGTKKLSNAMKHKPKNKKVKEEIPDHSMGFTGGVGPGAQSNVPDGGHLNLSELSTEKLAQYKKAAYADAKKSDSKGNYARGDKRFKGINKATTKQFDNDLKKHDQNPIKEANAKKRTLKNSNPCWTGYHPVGTKKKGGRTVPNCVPKD
jgi:hypothetical protein